MGLNERHLVLAAHQLSTSLTSSDFKMFSEGIAILKRDTFRAGGAGAYELKSDTGKAVAAQQSLQQTEF